MGVPFRVAEREDLGTAAFLHILQVEGGFDGALFVVNSFGEPVEFCFSRADVPVAALWRGTDLKRRAAAELCAALLGSVAASPLVLLALAEEVGEETFSEDMAVQLPVGRVTGVAEVMWAGGMPVAGSPEAVLVEELARTDVLSEAFERAALGLQEALGESPVRPPA
jgi:hypothetical protein